MFKSYKWALFKHRLQNPEPEPFLLGSVIEQFEQEEVMPKGIHITKDQSFSSPWRAGSHQGYFFHADNYFFREDFGQAAKINIEINQQTIDHAISGWKWNYEQAGYDLPDERISTALSTNNDNLSKLKVGNVLVGSMLMEDTLFQGSLSIITECEKSGVVKGRFITTDRSHITDLPIWVPLSDLVGEVLFDYFDLMTPGEMEVVYSGKVKLIPNYQHFVLPCYSER
jgi:hypothetical protein